MSKSDTTISKNIGSIKANDGTGEKVWNVQVTFHPDKAGTKNRPFCKILGRAMKSGRASAIGGCLTVEAWNITPIRKCVECGGTGAVEHNGIDKTCPACKGSTVRP